MVFSLWSALLNHPKSCRSRKTPGRLHLGLEPLEDRCLLSFGPPTNYPVGIQPQGAAVGDFRGIGVLDLVVANPGRVPPFGNTVSVLLGNGDGTFQPAVNYTVGLAPASVAVGDFNNDGKLDIVTANNRSNTISLLLGNGDGTFQPALNYAAGAGPISVVAGDFNNDGNLDLAVANVFDNTVSVLLGNGDGTFLAPISYAVSSTPYFVAAGDFNNDGNLDLVVAQPFSNNLSVLLGNGDGTFRSAYGVAAGGSISVAVGDFNGDGNLDLAVSHHGGNNISVLLGNGDGTFQTQVDYPVGAGPRWIAVGDFNNDGKLDLVTANQFSNTVSVLLGNGDGTFQGALNYPTGATPFSVAVGDFNGDGFPDLATANNSSNTVSVLLNQADWPAGPFGPRAPGLGSPGDRLFRPGPAIPPPDDLLETPGVATIARDGIQARGAAPATDWITLLESLAAMQQPKQPQGDGPVPAPLISDILFRDAGPHLSLADLAQPRSAPVSPAGQWSALLSGLGAFTPHDGNPAPDLDLLFADADLLHPLFDTALDLIRPSTASGE